MIVGHIASGLLVQYYALTRSAWSKTSEYPSWCTVFGATLNDIITGLFVLTGIEKVRSDPSFTPLGFDLTYIDWSHSFLMITVWALIWAMYCHVTVNRTHRNNQVWLYSFLAVMAHLPTDYVVHQPDMALYPNDLPKHGLSLGRYIPALSWFGELLFIVAALALVNTQYGAKKTRVPAILLVIMHLMNYPGAITNIPYTLGRVLQNHQFVLRLIGGVAFIGTYVLPGILISQHLDGEE